MELFNLQFMIKLFAIIIYDIILRSQIVLKKLPVLNNPRFSPRIQVLFDSAINMFYKFILFIKRIIHVCTGAIQTFNRYRYPS